MPVTLICDNDCANCRMGTIRDDGVEYWHCIAEAHGINVRNLVAEAFEEELEEPDEEW